MADEEQVNDAPEAEETEAHDPARARAALEKKNREAQALRARLKELEPLAVKAREADEAAKTELQKATERITAAEERATKAEMALLRRDAAEEAGLPRSWADRLQGATPEEFAADAKKLAADLGPKDASPARTAGRPVADLKPGALPAGDQQQMTGSDVDAWIRRQAGVR